MQGFEQFDSLISSETMPNAPQPFFPIIMGNWNPHRSKEELKEFIGKLSQEDYSATYPIYLALPPMMIPDNAADLESRGIVIGSNAMHSVAQGSFTEDIATDFLKNLRAHFVLLRADRERASYPDIHLKIRALLDHDVIPILCIGENGKQFQQGQTVEVLTEMIRECLQDIPEDQLSRVSLIYSSPWISEQGLSSLKDNMNKSCQVCQHVLKNLFGSEQHIRVMSTIPHFITDFSTYLQETRCGGFCFFDLATHSDHFLKILAAAK